MSEKNKKQIVLIQTHDALQKLIQSKMDAMPKNFNQTRFMQNCMTVLQDTNGIEECQPLSVARTLLKGAFLGLDFFQKECYAIIYKKKVGNNWISEVQFQTDYKGETKLAKKYSIRKIKDVYAKLVRDGDKFEEAIVNGIQTINFTPKPFSNADIIGVFAVVLYDDGGMEYEAMSASEVEEIKETFSKKSNNTGEFSKAWVATKGEMYKKTVLRRLMKKIEKDFESIEQAKMFDESSDFEFKDDSEVIDVYEEVQDQSTEEQPQTEAGDQNETN